MGCSCSACRRPAGRANICNPIHLYTRKTSVFYCLVELHREKCLQYGEWVLNNVTDQCIMLQTDAYKTQHCALQEQLVRREVRGYPAMSWSTAPFGVGGTEASSSGAGYHYVLLCDRPDLASDRKGKIK